jgi:DNA-binding transcriptional LysR family regulator
MDVMIVINIFDRTVPADMEIRNLITFERVYKLKSFSKAAAELGYSQSAVTMQIKQLESELKVRLFDRIGRTVDITNEGRRFLKYAEEIIATSQNAMTDLTSGSGPSGELRIGILESVCTTHLPQILSCYHNRFPQVSTIIKIRTFDELSVLLNTNDIDVLWTFDKPVEHPEWVKAFAYNSDINVVCAPSHGLALRGEAVLADIAPETFILTEKNCSYRKIFEDYMNLMGYQPKVFLEIGNTDIIKQFVQAELGLAVLPRFTLEEDLDAGKLKILHLSDYRLQMQGQLFYHRSKWLSPALKEFLEVVRESALI